jgi:hypothetical protein
MSSYTDVVRKLFYPPVPKKIGSLAGGPSLDASDVMPMFSADKVFSDIREYLDFLISAHRHW